MELEVRAAEQTDFAFAWPLYRDFVRENMFSGASGRRDSSMWDERAESTRFQTYWRADERYLITVDGQPVGWIAIQRKEGHIIIENWQTLPEWQNRDLAKIILGDLVPKWKREGLEVEASILSDSKSTSAAEAVLASLGFTHVGSSDHSKTMRLV